MTIKHTTEITCDKCGSDIDPESVYWNASVRGFPDPSFGMSGGPALQPDWIPNVDLPDSLDICMDCVPGLLGGLIWGVAKQRREANNGATQ